MILQELSAAGLSLVFTEKNLVDLVWEDHGRPDPPNEGLMVLDIAFTGLIHNALVSQKIYFDTHVNLCLQSWKKKDAC